MQGKPKANVDRLWQIIDSKCLHIRKTPVRLSTGGLSHYYFDCKCVTLDGEGLSLIADAFLKYIDQLPKVPRAIGGLTMGADFITAAVAMKAYEKGLTTVHGSIVRKEPKKHGTMSRIENELSAGTSIIVIDDVITTGNATRKACEAFIDAGYKIAGIVVLIDREQGAKTRLEERFACPVYALFQKSDFPRAKNLT